MDQLQQRHLNTACHMRSLKLKPEPCERLVEISGPRDAPVHRPLAEQPLSSGISRWTFQPGSAYIADMAEKSLNALNRDIRALYTKGHEALIRDNFDYAIDLFNQVLAREPGLYECRKELRSAQQRKAGSGGGFFKRFLSSAGSQPNVARAQLAVQKNPAEAMQIAEQILNNDPTNASAHRVIVEAARILEMPRTASTSLEILLRNHPQDKDVAIKLAIALGEIGEAQRAERILGEMIRLNPGDNELAQALKNLSARKTLDEGGYEALADGSGSYRDILRDKNEAVSLEQENRQVRDEDAVDRLIRDYETRLSREPNNLKLVKDLGELHTQKKSWDKALGYYARLKNSDAGGDAGVDRAITETTLRKYNDQLASVDPDSPDREEIIARLQIEKEAFAFGESQKLVDRFPTDLQIRFDHGVLLFEQGKIAEAISEFQKAQSNPHRRVASMNYLAQCFAKRKMYDLAARTLQNAIKEKLVFDDEKKELVYNLGDVLDKLGKKAEAAEQFKLIYEVDIGYKDVSARVEQFYAGG